MSGPIVRTGTNPKFWSNWDLAFGKKSSSAEKKKAATASAKAAKKPAKKAKKPAKKKK